jgi:class 3 adenylate cyclase
LRRKLTTIIAADVVGCSRLLSEDETGTLSAIESLRRNHIEPKAYQYSGRIFRFLGDGTLLEFDSAYGAVKFAIGLQKSLNEYNVANPRQHPLILRIGINLGDVVIENDDLHGDGVNIAVRLEGLAEPSGICLSDSVYMQVKHKLCEKFISIGPRTFKNIIDPIHVWRWRLQTHLNNAVGLDQSLADFQNLSGQHIIDPKMIDLLLRLHARSALLAVSNAFDAIVDEKGERAKFEQLYYHISEQLQLARSMLNVIQIERVDNYDEISNSGTKRQTMGEFVSSMLNDSKIGYGFKIVQEAQAIVATDQNLLVKRKRFIDLVRRFHNDDYIAKCRSIIKYAYID